MGTAPAGKASLSLILLLSWASAACSNHSDCTDNLVYGLSVKALGGGEVSSEDAGAGGQGGASTTGVSGRKAQVVARDGKYEEVLECSAGPRGSDCQCSGASERKGTATLGRKTEAATNTVRGEPCHVKTRGLVFFE